MYVYMCKLSLVVETVRHIKTYTKQVSIKGSGVVAYNKMTTGAHSKKKSIKHAQIGTSL